MSAREHPTLSGQWAGYYAYPADLASPVAFNALLVEEAGALSGECVEPNTFSPDPIHELFASLSGARNGFEVAFDKAYEGATRAMHTVRYEGVADAALARIEGLWRIPGFLGLSGRFVMTRSDAGEAVEREVEAEEAL